MAVAGSTDISFVDGSLTVVGTKVFELQHRCQTTITTTGFGEQVNSDFTVPFETYTDIKIWKVG